MSAINPVLAVHPKGESSSVPASFPPPHRVDTLGGSVEVHWERAPAVTRHGLHAYFIDFLKTSNTWSEFVDSCPLTLKLCTACKAFTARAPEAVRRRVLIGIC